MASPRAIQLYFEAQARSYDRRSLRGIWSRLRAREADAVLRLLGPVIHTRVLDLGCGSGFYAERIRERGGLPFGVDSSPAMIAELSRKKIPGVCADVLSFRHNGTFPVLVAAGLVEFVDDASRFFRSTRKLADDGARLVLLVPRAGPVGRAYELAHHWMGCRARARSLDELRASAAKNGWEWVEVIGAGPLAWALRFSARRARG